MSKSKHTPGPWDICFGSGGPEVHAFPHMGDRPIADIPSDTIGDGEANAKLIAASPDLLEACKYVVQWHREHDTGEGELFGLDFVTTCISAIDKATK